MAIKQYLALLTNFAVFCKLGIFMFIKFSDTKKKKKKKCEST